VKHTRLSARDFSGGEPVRSFMDQKTWKGIGSNPVIRAMMSHQFQNPSSPVLPQWRKARPQSRPPSARLAFSSASMQARTASLVLMGLADMTTG
jgi:hypothetical protein